MIFQGIVCFNLTVSQIIHNSVHWDNVGALPSQVDSDSSRGKYNYLQAQKLEGPLSPFGRYGGPGTLRVCPISSSNFYHAIEKQ